MSDSPPPSWGPAPYDDRDLDAVLSGDSAGVPEALRAVDTALWALRAAPARAELDGEEAARAAFRRLAPAAQPALAPADASAAPGALLTQIPPARVTAEVARPRPHSHRQGRRVHRRVGWQAVAVLGGAAAAAVACAAFAGAFAGPGSHHGAPPEAAPMTIARPSGSAGSDPRTLTGGAAKETPKATPTVTGGQKGAAGQGQDPETLCHALAAYAASPSDRDSGTAQDDYQKLEKLAPGESPLSYCTKVLGHPPWTPPVPYSGSHQGGQGFPVYRSPGRWAPGGHGGFGSGRSRGGSGFGGQR